MHSFKMPAPVAYIYEQNTSVRRDDIGSKQQSVKVASTECRNSQVGREFVGWRQHPVSRKVAPNTVGVCLSSNDVNCDKHPCYQMSFECNVCVCVQIQFDI